MEQTPTGLAAVDEDTRLLRLDEWSRNLVALAKAVCNHVDPAQGALDERGHAKRPCTSCMKAVRHVTEYWCSALLVKAKAIEARAQRDKLEVPTMPLSTGVRIAASVLEPAVSVQIEGWGPA